MQKLCSKYDFLIVGSGLYGLTWNKLAQEKGKSCLIIEKRDRIGGNIITEDWKGIPIHKYGPHIFHTNNKKVWNFVNLNCKVEQYINQPIANYQDTLYNLPFNMNTFCKIFNKNTPEEVKNKIQEEIKEAGIKEPKNLEEQAISMVGTTIYTRLIKFYTEKQWGRPCAELPPDIIKRLPLRWTFDNNYFNADYQGIPHYNTLVKKLSFGADILLNTDYFSDREKFDSLADTVVYTGPIDEFFNYKYGKLDWRTVYWKNEEKQTDNYQGCAVMNYTGPEEKYTRIIEHKHFYKDQSNFPTDKTVISYEFSEEYKDGKEKFYPINNDRNNKLLALYQDEAKKLKDKFIFGGRLAEYKYYDMDKVIEKCMNDF
jgi:UDP-galactopyranose mutase